MKHYLDEWHANNYPAWIREASNGKAEVAYAYALIDSPRGGMSTTEWCSRNGIAQCATIKEVVEKSDAVVVLPPDNCEMHEKLCQLSLRSGNGRFFYYRARKSAPFEDNRYYSGAQSRNKGPALSGRVNSGLIFQGVPNC